MIYPIPLTPTMLKLVEAFRYMDAWNARVGK